MHISIDINYSSIINKPGEHVIEHTIVVLA